MTIGWRSMECRFVPGNFSRPLIEGMGANFADARTQISGYIDYLKANKCEINITINDVNKELSDIEKCNGVWESFEFSTRLFPFAQESISESEQLIQIDKLLISTFGILISLIGIDEENSFIPGESEGDVSYRTAKMHERKKINRDLCIKFKGTVCQACGFDFERTYGEIGKGFIQIHHVKPVATINSGYIINILTDLVPLCSNCHSMAHTSTPPLSIEEIKLLLERNSNVVS